MYSCVCVCFESNSASYHVFRSKNFVSKGGLWVSFLPCLLWNQNPHFVTESSVCDIPAPLHCSSWWCHKWRIMILAGGTDEVRRNKDLLCLQLSLVMGRWGWEVKLWASHSPWWKNHLHTERCESSRVWLLKFWLTTLHPYPTPILFPFKEEKLIPWLCHA